MKLIDADKLIEKLSAGLDNPEELPVISIGTVMRMIDGEEEIHISEPEIIHCGECVNFVERDFCKVAGHNVHRKSNCMKVFGAERRTDADD